MSRRGAPREWSLAVCMCAFMCVCVHGSSMRSFTHPAIPLHSLISIFCVLGTGLGAGATKMKDGHPCSPEGHSVVKEGKR